MLLKKLPKRLLRRLLRFAFMFTIVGVNGGHANLGNPNAPQGGTLYYNLDSAPTTLHVLSSTDYYASRVQDYCVESLLGQNAETYEWEPNLATSWKINKEGTEFEFTLREGVKWHDGKMLTAEDVKFSFDAVVDSKNTYKTAHKRPYYEDIASVEVVDAKTVKFKTKKKYFKNFETAAGMPIIPKHIYENPSKESDKKLNKTIIASGPYKLTKYDRTKGIELSRNKDWWGNQDPAQKGLYNIEKIHMKFVKDGTIALKMLEKGELDFLGMTPEDYVQKAVGPKWDKTVFKMKAENKAPKGYTFMGFNLLDEKFKSKKARLALYHLVNRPLMIEKFLFDMHLLTTGPVYYQSEYTNQDVKAVDFNPKRALELLREDGWTDSDNDKILDKIIDGKKVNFSFTILEPNQDFVKYLTIFKEDAKKAGVNIDIKYIEWNSFLKLLDEKKFEAIRLAWGGGSVDVDPKQIWHSDSIKNEGSNFISYANSEVDKLIDQAREELDKKARIKILKKVYKIIADDVPYVFFFNPKYATYAHTERMKRVKDTYQYSIGLNYWWISK